METIRGTVERVTFQNDDTGFAVFQLKPEQGPVVACVGTAPTIEPGLSVVLSGQMQKHKRYGAQFEVAQYEVVRPTTVDGIYTLLSSGFIASIGEVRARAIVDQFGVETLNVFDTDIEQLRKVPGIGAKTLTKIRTAWENQKGLRELILFLQPFGVTLNFAYKIHRAYGAQAQSTISANPYQLIDDIWGVGFKRADAIAQKLGYAHDTWKRILAGLRFTLEEASSDGHCFLPAGELTDRAAQLLEVDPALVTHSLDHAATERLIVVEEQRAYLPALHSAECAVARMVAGRLRTPAPSFDQEFARRWFTEEAARKGWQVDGRQIDACMGALASTLFVLTGGPGTGKTTTLYLLVTYLMSRHQRVALAAPTGRAAQRMGSLAGTPAQTIHRLLEFHPEKERTVFGRNDKRPLDTDVVIVDEVSMVDIYLMRSLLEALPPQARLVLVGDSHQLPSIGPGNVLADLIAQRDVTHVELTTLFRQASQSRIVTCAHQIMHGETPRFTNTASENCFFVTEEDPEQGAQTVVDLVCNRLPRTYNLNPRTEIQVLSPMHRGPLGTQALNRALQQKLSQGGTNLTRGETTYTVGDRVMQVRNNYDRNVFNGDIGFVVDIDSEGVVWVDFAGTRTPYATRELDELTHAFCISIHKSQGCEFPAVVIPMSTQHFVMLRRNLVYTALTRARKLCVFVGSHRALSIAARATENLGRFTTLTKRIDQAA